MNIFIEVYTIRHPYVGVGEFCLNLGKHLANQATSLRDKYGIELFFIVPRNRKGIFGNQVHYVSFPRWTKPFLVLYSKQIDLLHLTHQYCTFTYFAHVDKTLLTVHDINFIYEKQGKKLRKYVRRFRKLVERVNYINYISKFAKADTEKHFSVTVPNRVIYNGVRKLEVSEEGVSEEFKKKIPKEPFFFHISSLRPKKNVHLLIEMMRYLKDKNLVVAGDWNTSYGKGMKERIQLLGLSNVVCLDHVSTQEKAWLYKHCEAFFFPSACEGFGLPPVEAMHFGKPVFLSTLTSLPEVGGVEAFYWKELIPEKMARVVSDRLALMNEDTSLPQKMMNEANRFTWERCAQEYITYYLQVMGIKSNIDIKI